MMNKCQKKVVVCVSNSVFNGMLKPLQTVTSTITVYVILPVSIFFNTFLKQLIGYPQVIHRLSTGYPKLLQCYVLCYL